LVTSTGEEDARTPHRSASSAEAEVVLRFVRQFAVKLKAGLSTEKCLAALTTETRHGRVRRACQDMHATTTKGMSLVQAMRGHGRLFDDCVTGLVEWGERTRKLRVALASAADYLEHRLRLERDLRGAVARPLDALSLVLLATFIAAVVLSFLAKEVVPVASAGPHAAMSVVDSVAFGVSEAVRVAWPFVGVLGLLCFVALRLLPRHPSTRAWLDALALKLPLVGPAVRATSVAIFARTVGIRMQAGNTLAEAMHIAVITAPNLSVRQHIAATMQKIEKGRPYIDALVEAGLLRLGDVTAVQASERRGDLGALMLTLAGDREQEAATDVKTLRAVTHTLVVVLLGLAILGVMLTLYVPVFVVH
jgi:type II secretory pathway component PulF